jgi:predicted permease
LHDDDAEYGEIERELGSLYQIVRPLGRGAFGAVYLARERQLHRLVAIKALRSERAWSEVEQARLVAEARTLANLSHPAIVPLLTFCETANAVYMVMPYVDGETLAQRLARDGRLHPDEVRRILVAVADALAYAHGEGVIHRDLKPENIILERTSTVKGDAPERVRLIDFGVAAFPGRDPGVGGTRDNAGTIHYMSPEQALGETELDARSDIFALGALGYRMLAGKVPFDGPSAAAIVALICAGERPPLRVVAPDAPPDLVAAIDRCLHPNPAERWRRARELRDALLAGASGTAGALGAIVAGVDRVGARRGWRRRAGTGRRRAAGGALPSRVSVVGREDDRSRPAAFLSGVGADLRFAVRTLGKTPGFTAAVLLTLAIGIGATTVVFSAAEGLVLRQLPVTDPGSLVLLHEERDGPNDDMAFGVTVFRYDRYLAYREATATALSGLAAQKFQPFSVRLGNQARAVDGLVTSGNYFEVLGVKPALGRFYTARADMAGGSDPVAVVGYDFWKRELGGAPDILGKTLYVDSRPLTVIGVAPRGFNGAFAGVFAFNVWVPATAYQGPPPGAAIDTASGPHYEWMNLFGRLKPGVDIARANAILHVSGPQVPTVDPDTRVTDARVKPLTAWPPAAQEGLERFLSMLLAVAGVVLLLAAANAAGMLLARGAARRREVATRLAVGASRLQVVRQLLVESIFLCAAAGAIGIALAWWIMRGLRAWQPPFPLDSAIIFGIDGRVLGVATAIVLGTGILAGLTPALQSTRVELGAAMKEGGLHGGTRRTRARSGFVVAQIALSVVLLALAGLFARSLRKAADVDPGFDTEGVLHAGLDLAPHGYDEQRARLFYGELLDGLRARPEIIAASLSKNPPLSGNQSWSAVKLNGDGSEEVNVQWSAASVGFMELLRVPLLAGRTFTPADGPDAPPVAVINETLAHRLWPGESPSGVLGRVLEKKSGGELTVVGVMRDGKYFMLLEKPAAFGYVPFQQHLSLTPFLYVRARGSTSSALRAAREVLAKLDPNIALQRPKLLASDVDGYRLGFRVEAVLVGIFAVVGLVLAMTGLFGVLAFAVAQRQREFGVRAALGADRRDVMRLVVREGLALAGIGTALGLLGALVAGRLVSAFLFGVSPMDPATLVAVPLVLVAVALLATVVPARRASAVDPMSALRAE